ncbi:MAG: tRNA pseudouridine(13) synthase TruD [Candidatus Aenigmarchaeota archaeon]|nr:tRNA pseudouridine(13) synthase TruD [Candidatus Aenigmarchaeota archaeon]
MPIKARGDERDLLVFPKDLKCKIEKDDLNKNRLKATFEFSLQKGSYATLVVKEIFANCL